MAKITRANQKLFGKDGPTGEFGQFGSLAGGSPVFTKDMTILQSLTAWLNGFGSATIANNRPALEDVNSVLYAAFYQICYLLQQGIAEWESGTEYHTNSYVQVSGILYRSLQDTNTNHSPASSPTWWQGLGVDTPGSLKIVTGSTLPAGGYLWTDGTSYLRADYPALSAYYELDGFPHGAADATHFNVPDTRGRGIVDQLVATIAATLGAKFGALNHVHAQTVHQHGAGTLSVPAHQHTMPTGGATDTGGGSQYAHTNITNPNSTQSVTGNTADSAAVDTGQSNGPSIVFKMAVKF